MLLSSLIISNWGSCSFHAYPFNRSVVSSLQVLFILSSLASLFNRSVVRIWYSLFLIYLVSTRVISIPSCPLCSSFIALQLQGSHDGPCFSFLSECYQFRSTPLCSFFQLFNLSKFFGFTHLLKKQLSFTSPLPLPFLSGAILDLGTRSSRSGGVL